MFYINLLILIFTIRIDSAPVEPTFLKKIESSCEIVKKKLLEIDFITKNCNTTVPINHKLAIKYQNVYQCLALTNIANELCKLNLNENDVQTLDINKPNNSPDCDNIKKSYLLNSSYEKDKKVSESILKLDETLDLCSFLCGSDDFNSNCMMITNLFQLYIDTKNKQMNQNEDKGNVNEDQEGINLFKDFNDENKIKESKADTLDLTLKEKIPNDQNFKFEPKENPKDIMSTEIKPSQINEKKLNQITPTMPQSKIEKPVADEQKSELSHEKINPEPISETQNQEPNAGNQESFLGNQQPVPETQNQDTDKNIKFENNVDETEKANGEIKNEINKEQITINNDKQNSKENQMLKKDNDNSQIKEDQKIANFVNGIKFDSNELNKEEKVPPIDKDLIANEEEQIDDEFVKLHKQYDDDDMSNDNNFVETQPDKQQYLGDKFVRITKFPKENEIANEASMMPFFLVMSVFILIAYIFIANKQKAFLRHCLGLVLEGRPGKNNKRRPNTANYRKLNTNLEEAITSTGNTASSQNVIY